MEKKIKEALSADVVVVKDAYGDGRHVSGRKLSWDSLDGILRQGLLLYLSKKEVVVVVPQQMAKFSATGDLHLSIRLYVKTELWKSSVHSEVKIPEKGFPVLTMECGIF
ncbi:hypothetical protein GIB67_012511 [Kingdonia uniflora]|uniref:Uncharacterized protein n=1 Tax=Kingdonia uniflora TaxID=39325 RepID=A0A7J7MW02_9MAGN|nr:hypothetical protein GIB67_012511 [Kingdonia uniflora]